MAVTETLCTSTDKFAAVSPAPPPSLPSAERSAPRHGDAISHAGRRPSQGRAGPDVSVIDEASAGPEGTDAVRKNGSHAPMVLAPEMRTMSVDVDAWGSHFVGDGRDHPRSCRQWTEHATPEVADNLRHP